MSLVNLNFTTVSATTFTGNLVGDVTGNVTGNITGNADTATAADTVTIAADATNASFYPAFVSATSGDLAAKVDAGLTYNPSTNVLTVTGQVTSGALSASGTAGLGYATGAGGAVEQATSRTTGVTLNKPTGAITLVSAAGDTAWASFTVTNSTVAATDTVVLSQKSGADLYQLHVTAVGAGSFQVTFATTGGTTTEQPVFNFAVVKGVAA